MYLDGEMGMVISLVGFFLEMGKTFGIGVGGYAIV
jgi:hypothetical protein